MKTAIESVPIQIHRPRVFQGLAVVHQKKAVALTPEVNAMLQSDCVVAIGVSGGKDSDACAIAVSKYLDMIGHSGPRILIHSDLGRVEWKDSLPACQRLATLLGWELMVVRRNAGDLMDRWQTRWKNNVSRYNDLSCVKLILPWSTPSLRFCTSEAKTDIIAAQLKKRFPSSDILNVTGVRRQESPNRQKMPVAAVHSKLTRKHTRGLTWNAIIEWRLEDVFDAISEAQLPLHEAYSRYHTSRVSCCFCMMGSIADLTAAAGCEDNHDVYRLMVDLEAESTFAFQGNRWLADVAPHLLGDELQRRVKEAKAAAAARQKVEALLPKHLLYTAGWPTCLPSDSEAGLIAHVRREVSALVGLEAGYLTGEAVKFRYAELLAAKGAAKGKRRVNQKPVEV